MKNILGKIKAVKEMATLDVQEAVDFIPKGDLPKVKSRFLASTHGKCHGAFSRHIKVHMSDMRKHERPGFLAQMKQKYNVIEFMLGSEKFYAGMDQIDDLLTLLRSYHAN